jgi:hypothetical protein
MVENPMKLIATWLSTQEPASQAPHELTWGDGQRATTAEYEEHCGDTRFCVTLDDGRFQWHLFPDVVAEVYFCPYGKVWGVRGSGIERASLYVTDPDATDAEICWALSALPITYRAKIARRR